MPVYMPTFNITLLYISSSKQKYPHRADRPWRLTLLHSSCALADQALRKGPVLLSKYHMGHVPGEPSSHGIWEDGHTDVAAIGMKRLAERAVPPDTKPFFLLAGQG